VERDELLQAILDSCNDEIYPMPFLSEYTIMECLSDRNGISTFLVADREGTSFVAKCYENDVYTVSDSEEIRNSLSHDGLPKYRESFRNENMTVIVREYIEGIPLSRYAADNQLSEKEIIDFCVGLCDILAYLHHREAPVIHRDIKPQNIIVRPDKSLVLIDFDIARIYRSEKDTDTVFFGTLAYAPPEQYGFSQTDARTDIYSLGILLRFLLTGSTRENKNVKVYKPLARIIEKCTAFSPKERFSDVDQVKKALLAANPRTQRIRKILMGVCVAGAAALLVFAGVKIYQAVTWTPFSEDAIPAYASDEERVADAVSLMKEKYGTTLFDDPGKTATIGNLRAVLIEVYGLDRDYVYGFNEDRPQESDEFFLPWGYDDDQLMDRDTCAYAAVKAYDPERVADWSSVKDDNGFYPGLRVAMAFAEETGILTGANKPKDITVGDMALIFANADRVFSAAE